MTPFTVTRKWCAHCQKTTHTDAECWSKAAVEHAASASTGINTSKALLQRLAGCRNSDPAANKAWARKNLWRTVNVPAGLWAEVLLAVRQP
jgi:hypothetical protein